VRYGLVRQIDGVSAAALDKHRLQQAGCDVLLEEGPPTRATLRAQWGLIFNLKAGDELLVCGLDALQMTTGQLVLMLQRFAETGVVLKIVREDGVLSLDASGKVRSLLSLLAANEAQRPEARRPRARSRPKGKPLNRYQIEHARELIKQGASLRTISHLFQTSPAELSRQLKGAASPEVVVSLGERRKATGP
jgi:DNA invertase Pin-like site-specific DNA recombinase